MRISQPGKANVHDQGCPPRHPFFVEISKVVHENSNILERCFNPVYGRPCWNVRHGYGSFLTMEFGEPSLRFREPSEKLRHRLVIPRGQWHLWIYCCNWAIHHDEVALASSDSSTSEIEKAVAFLDGQLLCEISAGAKTGDWKFVFDLKGSLSTSPYDEISDQWMLFEPDGQVLTSNAVGDLIHRAGSHVE